MKKRKVRAAVEMARRRWEGTSGEERSQAGRVAALARHRRRELMSVPVETPGVDPLDEPVLGL